MSEGVQIALIAGISAAIQTLVIAAFNSLSNRKRDKTVADIHTLVNSHMGEQLLIGMVSARTLVERDPTEENVQLLQAAQEKYHRHQAKQNRVDNRKKL
jgi:hypothetical protein